MPGATWYDGQRQEHRGPQAQPWVVKFMVHVPIGENGTLRLTKPRGVMKFTDGHQPATTFRICSRSFFALDSCPHPLPGPQASRGFGYSMLLPDAGPKGNAG